MNGMFDGVGLALFVFGVIVFLGGAWFGYAIAKSIIPWQSMPMLLGAVLILLVGVRIGRG
jgi:MFS superfamily sulfate permease-like transporter